MKRNPRARRRRTGSRFHPHSSRQRFSTLLSLESLEARIVLAAPVAMDDMFVTGEESVLQISEAELLTNDSDSDVGGTMQNTLVSFSDFTGASGLSFAGNATIVGDKLQLTSNAPGQIGSAWTQNKIDLDGDFVTEFNFGFPNVSAGSGADGMSFVIQNASNTLTVNEDGPASNDLTVSFDSFQNAGEPSQSFIEVLGGGTSFGVANLTPFDLSGTVNNQVRLEYTPGSLNVIFNGSTVLSNVPVDLGALDAIGIDGQGYAGFGARTGGSAEEHNVNSWTLTRTMVTPPDLLIRKGIRYDGFAGASGLQINGNAAIVGDNLVLTPAVNNQQGSAYLDTKQYTQEGFSTEFTFDLRTANAGADGVYFAVHNNAGGNTQTTSETGPADNTLTIELDSHDNGGGSGDPSAAHISVRSGSAVGDIITTYDLNQAPFNISDLGDSGPHTVRVDYLPGSLNVYFDGTQVINGASVNLGALNAIDGNGESFVGLGARTGGLNEESRVSSWMFRNATTQTLSSGAILTANIDGSYTYDTNGQFNALGADDSVLESFTYSITDGHGGMDTATVDITVQGENDLPTANDDGPFNVAESGTVNIPEASLLSNDVDPDLGPTSLVSLLNFNNFTSAAGSLSLVGSANIIGPTLQVTPSTESQQGSAWFNNKVFLEDGFVADFNFSFLNPSANGGADGLAFVIQNLNTGVNTGEDGPGSDALTISLDSWQNTGDPSISFVEVRSGGVSIANANLLPFDLSGSSNVDARVRYVPGDLDITINGVAILSDLNIDLAALGAIDGSGEAFVGFGARTGGATEEHNINSWSMSRIVTSSPDVLSVSGPAGTTNLPSGAAITLNGDGSFTYDPNGAFEALGDGDTTSDTFTYTVTDSQSGTDTATVTVIITGENDNPDALDDAFNVNEDSTLTIGESQLLTNDVTTDAGVTFDRQLIDFPDFSAAGGLNFVGTATIVGNKLQLTSNANSQSGSVWTQNRIDLAGDFVTEFNIGFPNVAGGGGADGMSFVIQNTSNTLTVGENGPASNDLTISFDSYDNGAPEPSGSFIEVLGGGTSFGVADLTPFELSGSDNNQVRLEYSPGSLNVIFNGNMVLSNIPVDLAALNAIGGDGRGYAGFGARTGGAAEEHNLNSWTLTRTIVTPSDIVRQTGVYFDRFDTAGGAITTVGSASVVGEVLRITPSQNSQQGSAWLTAKQPVAAGFEADFDIGFENILQPDGRGADGMSFVVHDQGLGTNVGEEGLGQGGAGLSIKFDSFQNAGDVSRSYIRVQGGGTNFGEYDLLANQGLDLSGTGPHAVRLTYTPGDLDVFFNGNPIFSDLPVDLNTIGAVDGSGNALVGFGARTGGAAEEHNVHSFYLMTPQTTTLSGGGILTRNIDGSYSFDTNGQYETLGTGDTAVETFTYSISDGHGGSDTATVTITIDGVNDPPTPNPDTNNITEGVDATPSTPATGNVLTNDTDIDTPNSEFTVQMPGTYSGNYGALELNADGSYTYTLNDANPTVDGLNIGDTLMDTFTYSMTDEPTTTILPLADFTTAADNGDSPASPYAGPLFVRERANENNPELEVEAFLKFDLSSLSAAPIVSATLELHENNKLNAVNSASLFIARVLEAWNSTGSDPVFAEETVPNDGAGGITDVDNEFSFGDNGPANAGPNVDIDFAIDITTWAQGWAADPSTNHGVRLRIDDAFVAATFDDSGAQAPRLTIVQDLGAGQSSTLTITINGANDSPVANDDTDSVVEDTATTTAGNALSNDTDVDNPPGDLLVLDIDGETDANNDVVGTYGSLDWGTDGSYTYTLDNANSDVDALNSGDTLTDAFTYTVSDAPQTTTTVPMLEFATAAENDTVGDDSPAEGGQFAGPLYVRERANENNPELEVEAFLKFDLSTLSSTPITSATLELHENHKLNSVNSANLFIARVLESWNATGMDPVFAEETVANDGPGGLTDVDSEFQFGDNGPASAGPAVSIDFSIDITSWVQGWAADPSSNHGVRLRIDDAFVGAVFDHTGADAPRLIVTQGGQTDTGTVTVTINGNNDAPVANPDTNSITEGVDTTPSTPATGNVLTNDTDVDNPNSAFTVVNSGTITGNYGSLELNQDGSYTYTLDDGNPTVDALNVGDMLSDAFNYTMSDNASRVTTVPMQHFTTAAQNDTVGDDSPAEAGQAGLTGPLYVRERANENNPELEVEAFLQFDLSGLSNDPIGSATLELHENHKLNSVNSGDLFIARVLEAWDASGNDPVFAEETTANDGAGGITDVADEFMFGNNGSASAGPAVSIDFSIDITTWVQGWLADPSSNHGVRLRISDAFVGAAFDDTGANAPRLIVTQPFAKMDSDTLTITIDGANDSPTNPADTDASNDEVVEGAAAGTPVGITAQSTDVDSSPLTYSIISDTSGGGFQIDSNSGVVTVSDPALLDYETTGPGYSHDITVQVDDGDGAMTTTTFTIQILNANPSTPVDTDGTTNAVDEGAANGTAVGITASSTDVNGPAVSYSITSDSSGGAFAIDSSSGIVTVGDTTLLDGTTTETITIQASDGAGGTSSATFNILVNNLDPDAVADSYTVDEDSLLTVTAGGSPDGLLSNDTDPAGTTNDPLTVTQLNGGALNGTSMLGAQVTLQSDGRFTYDPRTAAALQVLSVGETLVDQFTYTITDGDGGSDTATVSVTVTSSDAIEVKTTDDFVFQPPTLPPSVTAPVTPGADDGNDTVQFDLAGGNWEIRVNGNLLRTTGATGADIVVQGSSDNDTIVFNGLGTGDISVNGATGANTLTIDDSSDPDADTNIVVDTTQISGLIDNPGTVVQHSDIHTLNLSTSNDAATGDEIDMNGVSGGTITTVNVNGNDGADTFDVATNPFTAVNIVGGNPVAASCGAIPNPGDTLNVTTNMIDLPFLFPAAFGTTTNPGSFSTSVMGTPNAAITWVSLESFFVDTQAFDACDLFVRGTTGSDRMIFSVAPRGELLVRINDDFYGPFAIPGVIEVEGNSGQDEIVIGNNVPNPVDARGDDGDDYIALSRNNDTADGGAGNDTILAGGGNDVLTGGLGDDHIDGGSGNDDIDAGDGDDYVVGRGGNDTIRGGDGRDNIAGGDDDDIILGGAGDDTLQGNTGNDVMVGGAGNDSIFGLSGDIGGDDRDVLIGGQGADGLFGRGDDDILIGNATVYDASVAALADIGSEWNSTNDFTTRRSNLLAAAGVGASNASLQVGNILGDGAADGLTGDLGADWYLASGEDRITRLAGNDVSTFV